MAPGQDLSGPTGPGSLEGVGLRVERLGPLPLLNHFLGRLGLEELLERFVPTRDRRCRIPSSRALGVLVRSVLVERGPIYRQQETVAGFYAAGFGLTEKEALALGDDQVGRALDRLFDADRGTLLTEVVLAAAREFDLAFDELHNDSTTVRFCGQYAGGRGRRVRGQRTPWVTYGYSKDRRPDLKQVLFILTTTRDGAVPCQFRCEDGNRSDSRTHEQTWDALCRVAGRHDFLYVADSKLCGFDAMDHIARHGGRFVTVLPRSRLEDREFRAWVQDHEPPWEEALDRRNPRRRGGPRDRWWVFRHHLPSAEGWTVVWVFSSLLSLHQAQRRRERIARAEQDLERLRRQIQGPRPRLRSRARIRRAVDDLLRRRHVARYLAVEVRPLEEHRFRQERPGRPGRNTRYRRTTRRRWTLDWSLREDLIAYDKKSDGMYPLLTNDANLTATHVLKAHKGQPSLEKRWSQLKSVFEVAPVFLHNEARIDAFLFVYFLALLLQALLERELRRAMAREKIQELPLYPEERTTTRPTAEQILRLFALPMRHVLTLNGRDARVLPPRLTDLQKEVLRLLDVPETAYA